MVNSIIRELQNKTVRSHYTPIRGTTIQNTPPPYAGKNAEQELWFIAGGMAKWYSHCGSKTAGQFLTMLSTVLP